MSMGVFDTTAAYAIGRPVQLAAFDHGSLTASATCRKCHSRDQPDDDRHRQTTANCSACHQTQRWTPARVDSSAVVK